MCTNVTNRFQTFLARYLCPDVCVDSVTDIDPESLRQKGFTTLLLDLDNTLLSWKAEEMSATTLEWIRKAKISGLKLLIVSNSFQNRVNRLSKALEVPAISRAVKPRKSVFLEALRLLGSLAKETAVIGDQLFTDILGGKRLGLYTILVSPVDKQEFFATELVRIPEKMVLNLFQKKGLLKSEGPKYF